MKTKWPIHSEDEIDAVADVLRSGRTNYWTGEHGQAFEREWVEYTGAQHALTVTNGTTALELALHGIGTMITDGDESSVLTYNRELRIRRRDAEVIVPCRTFMATASAVVTSGMNPVLADINSVTLNVTAETLEARRTPRTVAVIVVHYAGLPCDMPAIMEWANKHSIIVIEDCAHAHGARINGKHVGTFGAVGCFSFCVGKIISTGGEGGMVICNDDAIHARMAARRDHGRFQMVGNRDMTQFTYEVQEFGTNLRLTEMQSAIGRLQLKKLDGWNAKRNHIATIYRNAINGPGIRHPARADGRVWYLYNMQVFDRDRQDLLRRLNERGIPARIGGCPNLLMEPVFGGVGAPCPEADAVGERTLSLPVYPTMTLSDVEEVCTVVNEELKR